MHRVERRQAHRWSEDEGASSSGVSSSGGDANGNEPGNGSNSGSGSSSSSGGGAGGGEDGAGGGKDGADGGRDGAGGGKDGTGGGDADAPRESSASGDDQLDSIVRRLLDDSVEVLQTGTIEDLKRLQDRVESLKEETTWTVERCMRRSELEGLLAQISEAAAKLISSGTGGDGDVAMADQEEQDEAQGDAYAFLLSQAADDLEEMDDEVVTAVDPEVRQPGPASQVEKEVLPANDDARDRRLIEYFPDHLGLDLLLYTDNVCDPRSALSGQLRVLFILAQRR